MSRYQGACLESVPKLRQRGPSRAASPSVQELAAAASGAVGCDRTSNGVGGR